jgi:hypothetical protein
MKRKTVRAEDIEITPEMIDAGVATLRSHEQGADDPEMIVDWVYRDMEKARVKEARLNLSRPLRRAPNKCA